MITIKNIVVLSLLAHSSQHNQGVVRGFAQKEIPDHISKIVVDPTKVKYVPDHGLSEHHIKAKKKDPHDRKDHNAVPRLPDDHILEDEDGIHEEELKTYFTDDHHQDAHAAHYMAARKRTRIEKETFHEQQSYNITNGLEVYEHHEIQLHDPEKRLEQPPEHPDRDFLRKMVILVHFREDYLKDHLEEDTLQGHLFSVEQEFIEHNIYYQSIEIRDENSLKVLCNDAEEREHIKHILLKHYTILSVDIEGKRFFSKWATDDERDTFKYLKSLDDTKRAKLEEAL